MHDKQRKVWNICILMKGLQSYSSKAPVNCNYSWLLPLATCELNNCQEQLLSTNCSRVSEHIIRKSDVPLIPCVGQDKKAGICFFTYDT